MTDGPRRGKRPVESDFLDDDELFAPEEVRPHAKRRTINLKVLRNLGILLLIIVLLAVIGKWVNHQFTPVDRQGNEVTVEIPTGVGMNAVGTLLASKDVVPSAWSFRLYDRIDRRTVALQSGEYAFRANSSTKQAMDVLAAGPKKVTTRLVIREGYRLRQIADAVGQIRGLSAEKFLEVANSGTVRSRYMPSGTNSLEGFVFPDTYLLSGNETEASLLQDMVNQADNVMGLNGLDSSLSRISQDPYQTITIASMIEAEAKTPGDRGKISRVIENRLYQAMPLQIDATVLYGIGNTKQELSNADLKRDTPYNTYTRKGLPVTPIGNPGAASIQAALNPTPGTWLYYALADADGNHAFADTYEQHQANVNAARAKGLF